MWKQFYLSIIYYTQYNLHIVLSHHFIFYVDVSIKLNKYSICWILIYIINDKIVINVFVIAKYLAIFFHCFKKHLHFSVMQELCCPWLNLHFTENFLSKIICIILQCKTSSAELSRFGHFWSWAEPRQGRVAHSPLHNSILNFVKCQTLTGFWLFNSHGPSHYIICFYQN